MVLYSRIRKWRLALTRGVGVLLGILILFSTSNWTGLWLLSDLFFLIGCFLIGIATIGRLWCSLYIGGYKSKSLVTLGPYSICRNPLYFFSLLGGLGIGFVTQTLFIPIVFLLFFIIYYPFVIKKEEEKLLHLHGDKFRDYCENTPVFLPRLSLINEPESYVVKPRNYTRHMLSALWFVWVIGLFEIIKSLHNLEILPYFIKLY